MGLKDQKQKLVVMKFGGSCLIDNKSFSQIIRILKLYLTKDNVIVTTSALSGITDKLLEFYKSSCVESIECDDLLEEISKMHISLLRRIIPNDAVEYQKAHQFIQDKMGEIRQLGKIIRLLRPSLDIQDLICSYGERFSTFILSEFLKFHDLGASFLSSDEFIITNDNFGRALPLLKETEDLIKSKLAVLLKQNESEVLCVTGYYGSTLDKKVTTLGRGGSDLTAAILAYSLRNEFECNVVYWKDVKGFLNADPQIADQTALLKQISYAEAKELTYFGSKILHPLCLDISEKGNIISEIRSFNDPESSEFTTITKEIIKGDPVIKAVTSIYKLAMVTIEGDMMVTLSGTASKLFSLLGDNNINVVFISQSSSENNITFGINFDDSSKVSFLLRNSEFFGKNWFHIKINNEISLVAVIGAGVLFTSGIAGRVFTSLGKNNINILAIAQGSSELNFTAIIERKNCEKAVNILYDAFINNGK
ncbi:MAG: aspartate kinase [Promethearchaeota archaeon]|nr:MAG: aspartate kinase [Candidatus Lokiarchaeota archaeon]